MSFDEIGFPRDRAQKVAEYALAEGLVEVVTVVGSTTLYRITAAGQAVLRALT